MLLKNWCIKMVIICCFISSDCNNTLRTAHFCSNDTIPIIESITLVNYIDFSHCDVWTVLP